MTRCPYRLPAPACCCADLWSGGGGSVCVSFLSLFCQVAVLARSSFPASLHQPQDSTWAEYRTHHLVHGHTAIRESHRPEDDAKRIVPANKSHPPSPRKDQHKCSRNPAHVFNSPLKLSLHQGMSHSYIVVRFLYLYAALTCSKLGGSWCVARRIGPLLKNVLHLGRICAVRPPREL